jgi:hypothetical protein
MTSTWVSGEGGPLGRVFVEGHECKPRLVRYAPEVCRGGFAGLAMEERHAAPQGAHEGGGRVPTIDSSPLKPASVLGGVVCVLVLCRQRCGRGKGSPHVFVLSGDV